MSKSSRSLLEFMGGKQAEETKKEEPKKEEESEFDWQKREEKVKPLRKSLNDVESVLVEKYGLEKTRGLSTYGKKELKAVADKHREFVLDLAGYVESAKKFYAAVNGQETFTPDRRDTSTMNVDMMDRFIQAFNAKVVPKDRKAEVIRRLKQEFEKEGSVVVTKKGRLVRSSKEASIGIAYADNEATKGYTNEYVLKLIETDQWIFDMRNWKTMSEGEVKGRWDSEEFSTNSGHFNYAMKFYKAQGGSFEELWKALEKNKEKHWRTFAQQAQNEIILSKKNIERCKNEIVNKPMVPEVAQTQTKKRGRKPKVPPPVDITKVVEGHTEAPEQAPEPQVEMTSTNDKSERLEYDLSYWEGRLSAGEEELKMYQAILESWLAH